jgi:uncharacterized protein (TIGR00369 family)
MSDLARYADMFNNSRSFKLLNLKLSFPSADKVLAELDPILPEHRGGLGTQAVNGGVLSAIFDLVIGSTPALVDPTRRSATAQLSIYFERPVHGDRLSAEGRVNSFGKTTLFSSATILDENGQVCARCSGIAKISSLPWAGLQVDQWK